VPLTPRDEVEPTLAPLPDGVGLRVVFIRDADLWLWDGGGEAVQLSTQGGVGRMAISEDGQVVAYTRSENFFFRHFEMWMVNADGTDERIVVDSEAFNAMLTDPTGAAVGPSQMVWIPGTHTLAYNTQTLFNGPGVLINGDLRLLHADTGQATLLLQPGQDGRFYYSPDGTQIALVTSSAISLLDADGTNRRDDLITYREIGLGEDFFYPEPVWSPDSQRIVVAIPSSGPYDPASGPSAVWEIPVDSAPPVLIGSIEDASTFVELTFSPDVMRLAFVSGRLDIANADGSDDTIYDDSSSVLFLGWSPDGQHFLYQVGEATTRLGQVGAPPIDLPGIAIESSAPYPVRWVDADRFLYLSRSEAGWELRLGNPGGASVLVGAVGDEFPLAYFDFAD
jgi:hypothetical protein